MVVLHWLMLHQNQTGERVHNACLQAAKAPEEEQGARQQSVPAQETDNKGWQLSPEGDAAILHGTELPLFL